MKKCFWLLIFFFLIGPLIQGQQLDSIVLPSVEKNEECIKNIDSNVLNIYITKEHHVYIENLRVLWWDEIITEILKLNRDSLIEDLFFSQIVVNSDKDASYMFVDRVKEEVARCEQKQLFFYRLGTVNETYYLKDVNHGTTKEIIPSEPIGTRGKLIEKIEFELTEYLKEDLSFIYSSSLQFRKNLYRATPLELKEVLSNQKYRTVKVLPEKQLLYEGQMVSFDFLNNLVDKNYLILVTFDKTILFSDYIYYLMQKTLLQRNYRELDIKNGIFVDISYNLERSIKQAGLKL